MEKNHQPEVSSSFKKRDEEEKSSGADIVLPATESPECSNEEKPVAAEVTEVEIEKPEEMKTGETEIELIEKPEEKENEGGGEEGEATLPPEIDYNLETASEDVERFLSSLSTPKEEGEVGLEIPEFLEKYLDLVEEKISKHEPVETKVKGCLLPEDDASFLKAVNQISKLYKNLSAGFKLDSNKGPLINRIGKIQQRAMSHLEDEFRSLLEDPKLGEPDGKQAGADHCPLPGNDQSAESNEESNFPGYSQEVLAYLTKIAKEMISGGYESECCEVFLMTRRNIIEETLNKLGFEKLSIDEVQKMQWEALEREIPTWIKAFKQCANVYFSGERKLAETIFSNHPSLSDSLFSNLTRGVVIQLLNFAEAVAISKRSTEKLFKFLDMYETLRDNLPAIDSLYPEECAKELRAETTTARCRIGEIAICIFCDLENSIKSDTGKTPVPGGAVHPLTRYTMNYLKYACEYKATLEQVFKEHSKIERADSTSRPRDYEGDSQNYKNDEKNHSPFAGQLMRIMDLLDANLEAKSKLYKDVSLGSIFMMNNGRYMLQKIKGSAEIHEVMGDTWCRKRSSDLRNYHKSYQRETWMKLLGCLSLEGLNVNGKVVKPVLKERFKSFNAMFDEIHKTQSSWVVSDEQLQSELRVSISAVVIPAYRSFLGRFAGVLDPGRQTEKYIKFQPEDIETYIDELFDGNPVSMAKRKT
ncbi:PREDICTED: exocyst complex component EXO70B1 [Theobroma cacao]|uniref:Exocyst subunit Exo70 family protein n=1 Tax=Theobroma cacao TaxID=3641 RepID=A0AB32V6S7_THECC|nr:PREDICTED: exocyst complex component EXO70B1 [Theobroma cacao]